MLERLRTRYLVAWSISLVLQQLKSPHRSCFLAVGRSASWSLICPTDGTPHQSESGAKNLESHCFLIHAGSLESRFCCQRHSRDRKVKSTQL